MGHILLSVFLVKLGSDRYFYKSSKFVIITLFYKYSAIPKDLLVTKSVGPLLRGANILPEAESKEKHGVWDPTPPELTITSP
jgi:hypothetical protein